MDLQAARSQALEAAGSPRGFPLQRVREAPPAPRLVLPHAASLMTLLPMEKAHILKRKALLQRRRKNLLMLIVINL
uniref:Uncharacterized protein n=1 Tax=Sciurus vulgaris TaxID=55149 RepID=A0A8D2CRA6_SCIVU